jgi:hypothetical protein
MMGVMRSDGEEVANSGWAGNFVGTLRGLLDRPLASYYLLLSSVGLLVFIGLVMVFSVTSVDNFATTGSPFTSIVKQARGPHLIVFKKRRRQNSRRKNGHRQDLTVVKIEQIVA